MVILLIASEKYHPLPYKDISNHKDRSHHPKEVGFRNLKNL